MWGETNKNFISFHDQRILNEHPCLAYDRQGSKLQCHSTILRVAHDLVELRC